MNLNEMIAAGCYDRISPVITEENFPMSENLVLGTEPRLFNFSEDVPEGITVEEDLIARMDRQGYRLANLWELLDFGAKNPNEQLNGPIIALGSECRDYVTMLSLRLPLKKDGPWRRILDVTLRQGCGGIDRFLGVRK